MAELYHASKTQLEIGTALESRLFQEKLRFQFDAIQSAMNEGEAVLKSLLLSDYWHESGKPTLTFPFKEAVLERIRSNEFPERPSRLSSVFLCPTKDDAIRFREVIRASDDRPYLYVCTVPDGLSLFQADIAYVRGTNPLAKIDEQIAYLTKYARLYWQGDKSDAPIMEILVPSQSAIVTSMASW